jgi:iron complex transport system substrate-binding protein
VNKRSYSYIFILLTVIFLCGCRGQSSPSGGAQSGDSQISRRTVKDELGIEVSIKPDPQRIVSLAPNITEILFALGLGPRVVGVTSYCNYPEEAKRIAKVGDTLKPNLEQIISLRPDLVLISTASQLEQFRARLLEAGIPVFALKSNSMDEVFHSIETIGQVTNREEQSKSLVGSLEDRLQAIKSRVSGRPRPRVFFIVGTEPLITAGRGSFITDLIDLAGGESISADLPTEWPVYSAETAIAKAPDIIIFPGPEHGSDPKGTLPKGLNVTPAGRNSRAYHINDELVFRPGPRIIDGLEEMARLFHPEVVR